MSLETRSGKCMECKERRKVTRKGINHVLHLLLSIVTFGFWLIVWLLVALNGTSWRCETCGSGWVREVR